MTQARQAAPARLRFSKMHGAGNDFVMLDLRDGRAAPAPALAAALADRHTGVGCDQIITIEAPLSPGAVAAYRIWNADGSQAQQCGNGARCAAAWLVRDGAARSAGFLLDSPAGPVAVDALGDGRFSLDMGRPVLVAAQVPFLGGPDTVDHALDIDGASVHLGVVSMGNPHAVIEVPDLDAAPVARLGPAVQARSEFPEGVNVGFAQILARDHIRLRVFERGVGETLACGSGACAAVVALARRGRVGDSVRVDLPGGTLHIDWPGPEAPVRMTGPAAFVFEGEWIA